MIKKNTAFKDFLHPDNKQGNFGVFSALWWTSTSVLTYLRAFSSTANRIEDVSCPSWDIKGTVSSQIPTQTKPFILTNWIQLKDILMCWEPFLQIIKEVSLSSLQRCHFVTFRLRHQDQVASSPPPLPHLYPL